MSIKRLLVSSPVLIGLALSVACTVKLNGKTYGGGSNPPPPPRGAAAAEPGSSPAAAGSTARTAAAPRPSEDDAPTRRDTNADAGRSSGDRDDHEVVEPEAGPPRSSGNDGFNPTLANQDDDGYDYELACGGSTERTSISARTVGVTLSKGCTLKILGVEQPLRGNMECEIRGGALTCD